MTDRKQQQKPVDFELTDQIITNLDLGRSIRELEKLDDDLHQQKLRGADPSQTALKTTEVLKAASEASKLSFTDAEQRKELLENLRRLKSEGKKIHISFAVEPSPLVTQKISAWLRQNIDKHLIIEVGIQPTISVGCVVRTTNKIFDMSLRNRFADSKKMLAASLEARS